MSLNALKAKEFHKDSDRIVAKMCENSKKLKDLSQYNAIEQNIKSNVIKKQFGTINVKVHFFGSRIIGTASNESDMDIFIEFEDNFYSSYAPTEQNRSRFMRMSSSIQGSFSDWTWTKDIWPTAVPVIVCRYRPMQLDCDISMTNGLSVCNSKLLAHLFNIQPEAVSLYHFVRQWLIVNDFNHLKGYTVTLLVLFYLQSKNLMPTIETVQRYLPKRTIDGWDVQFDSNRTLIDYNTSKMYGYKEHIIGFFSFYANRSYYNHVIQPYSGQTFNGHYKTLYPTFLLRGLNIAGPINKGKNCGIINNIFRDQFVQICKASTDYFRLNNL